MLNVEFIHQIESLTIQLNSLAMQYDRVCGKGNLHRVCVDELVDKLHAAEGLVYELERRRASRKDVMISFCPKCRPKHRHARQQNAMV